MSGSAAPGTVIAQIVETMRALAGSHPGFRPVHAKGIFHSPIITSPQRRSSANTDTRANLAEEKRQRFRMGGTIPVCGEGRTCS